MADLINHGIGYDKPARKPRKWKILQNEVSPRAIRNRINGFVKD